MERIKITTDSSSSLPLHLLKKYQISMIYLEIQFGNRIFQDCTEMTGNNLFEYHDQTGNFAVAIPVPTEAFPPFFDQFRGDYDYIIHIGSSTGSTRSYENACTAADFYPNVTVIDAGQVSGGMGLMVLQAAALAAKGASAADIMAEIERYRCRIYARFLIGTMEYFNQSERCSNITRLLTQFFHVRPSITVVNGKMTADKMYQGSDEVIRTAFISDFIKQIGNMEKDTVVLASSGCPAHFMERLFYEVADQSYFRQILTIQDSAAIASHCGPNTFGMYCFSREELRGRGGHEDFGVGRGRRHL